MQTHSEDKMSRGPSLRNSLFLSCIEVIYIDITCVSKWDLCILKFHTVAIKHFQSTFLIAWSRYVLWKILREQNKRRWKIYTREGGVFLFKWNTLLCTWLSHQKGVEGIRSVSNHHGQSFPGSPTFLVSIPAQRAINSLFWRIHPKKNYNCNKITQPATTTLTMTWRSQDETKRHQDVSGVSGVSWR